jgi:integrase/recombinase XerD
MSPLQETLDEYLAMRRALGHKLCLAGHLLEQFVAFADRAGATYVTTDLALAWATQPAKAQPAEWARRLGMARRFARYCSALDPRTTVPLPGLLPHRYQRLTFIATRRSLVYSMRRGNYPPQPGYGLIPTPRSSAYMR